MTNSSENPVILIDKNIAKKGHKFVYYESNVCKKCEYKDVCIGKLKQGRVYEIVDIIRTRKKILCPLTKSNAVLVEVKLADIETAVPTKKAISNIVIKWNPPICKNYLCKYRDLCFSKGLFRGDKIKIKRVGNRIQCPLNYDITLVSVLPSL